MTISNKVLGAAGIIAAPFLAIEMLTAHVAQSAGPQATTGWSAILDVVYMLGWMCSIYALLRGGAGGDSKSTNNILKTQLILLIIANIYNVWSATGIGTETILFRVVDMIWPISNAFMIVTGIAILRANALRGWKRYSVLAVGLWLPVSMIPMILFGREPITLYFGLVYSVIAWGAMGIAAWQTREESVVYNQFGYPELA